MKIYLLVALTSSLFFLPNAFADIAKLNSKMVLIPSGSYVPFFANLITKTKNASKDKSVAVKSFWMDQYPVTEKDFQQFLKKNNSWKKSNVKKIFADSFYLKNLKSSNAPVVYVSWFAAKAYCEFYGKNLPTVDEWEYVANDNGKGSKEAKEQVLSWYSKPNSKHLSSVGGKPNGFKIYNLYGLIWEWTLDFNSVIISDGNLDKKLFCGGGSLGAVDATDYAGFMRYSFRSSLKANYTIGNLGFRCIKEATQ